MQEAYPVISNIPTHIMTWGKWIEESFDENEKELVICISGNPGLPGFYTKFLSVLHSTCNREIPVWVIGHAGHDEEPESVYKKKVPILAGNEELFNLDAQIKHKVDFIRKYVKPGVKIHLIGHSIGAWIVLELLKIEDIRDKVQHCYLLFPTIERMAESSNGFILTKLVAPIFFILRIFYQFFSKLPMFLRICILYAYFFIMSIPYYFIGTGIKYSKPEVIDRLWFMALDEMIKVKELDVDIIKKNKNILKFYYGTTDGWVPVKYFHELKEKIPDVDAELCSKKYAHAFVLRSAVPMAHMVGEWILQNRVQN
uniref:Lipid droplet-associated hydrolase n=1 Tax=Corethrella appendiculata TaxID=1370023 RepID=U5EJC0_9DIPT